MIELSAEINKQKKEKIKKPVLTETQLRKRKSRKTKTAVAAFVLLLGIGVMGNWYYENTDLVSSIQPMISSEKTKTLGEASFVDAPVEAAGEGENEYFASARVNRQTARDEVLEQLQAVMDKTDESEDARAKAAEEIARVSNTISVENKIETLVTAKGVAHCLAVVSSDGKRVDVIVDTEELGDAVILQIKEIAMQELGCGFEAVSIIQSK